MVLHSDVVQGSREARSEPYCGTVKRVLEQVNEVMRRKATGRLALPGDRVADADAQGLIV